MKSLLSNCYMLISSIYINSRATISIPFKLILIEDFTSFPYDLVNNFVSILAGS